LNLIGGVMQVTHNSKDNTQGRNKEETMGSHHRCAYKAPGGVPVSLESDWREKQNNENQIGNHCECLCYDRTTSLFQKDVKRHKNAKFVNALQRNGLSVKKQLDEDARKQNLEKHKNSNPSYWVNSWGEHDATNADARETPNPTPFPTRYPTPLDPTTNSPTPAPTMTPTARPNFLSPRTEKWYNDAKATIARWKSSGLVKACITTLESELHHWRNDYVPVQNGHVDQLTWNGNVVKYHAMKYGFQVLAADTTTTKTCTQDSDCTHEAGESKEDGDTQYCSSSFNKDGDTCSRWTFKASKTYMNDWCTNLLAYDLEAYSCKSVDENSITDGFTDVTMQPQNCGTLARDNTALQKAIRYTTDHIKWNGGEPNTPCSNGQQRINGTMVEC